MCPTFFYVTAQQPLGTSLPLTPAAFRLAMLYDCTDTELVRFQVELQTDDMTVKFEGMVITPPAKGQRLGFSRQTEGIPMPMKWSELQCAPVIRTGHAARNREF